MLALLTLDVYAGVGKSIVSYTIKTLRNATLYDDRLNSWNNEIISIFCRFLFSGSSICYDKSTILLRNNSYQCLNH